MKWLERNVDCVTLLATCFSLLLLCGPSLLMAQDDAIAPMDLAGISESEAYDIEDGGPLNVEQSLLVRMMYRASKSSPGNLYRYSAHTSGLPYRQVIADPRSYRLWVFRVSGHATSLRW
ncbi:MAG: hypothetical protein AAF456_22235, partial [Planctomycetota bacterium]